MVKAAGFRMTLRDITIILAVYAYRALTSSQIETLLFRPDGGQSHPTKTSRARHRLKMLFQHGYLFRDEQPTKLKDGRKPLVYFIDKLSIPLLAEELGIPVEEINWKRRENNVTWQFLDHLLATNDVRIAIELAAADNGLLVNQWLDDKTLRSREMKTSVEIWSPQGRLTRVSIIPDGYCRLADGDDRIHLFLEADRGTRTNESRNYRSRDFARKIRGYLAYYSSGHYQEKYTAELMTILTVTVSQKRMVNMKKVVERIDVGNGDHFWFTTFDRIEPQTVLTEPIWEVAGRNDSYSIL